MPDLACLSRWGGDMALTPDGDIQTVAGDEEGVERIVRRLFTAQNSYLWEPGYGCGLLLKIGSPIPARTILGLIRSQIFQEAAVAQNPPPDIQVSEIPEGSGRQMITIAYQDTTSGAPMLIAFDTAVPAAGA